MKQMFGSILAILTLCLSCSLAYGNIHNQVRTLLFHDLPFFLEENNVHYSQLVLTNIVDALLEKFKRQLELLDSDNSEPLSVFFCFEEGGSSIQAHISLDCTDIASAEVFPVAVQCQ